MNLFIEHLSSNLSTLCSSFVLNLTHNSLHIVSSSQLIKTQPSHREQDGIKRFVTRIQCNPHKTLGNSTSSN